MSTGLLNVENVALSFGAIHVLNDVNLAVRAGEVLAVIGPNGAGKSSLLNVLDRSYTPTRGRIDLAGTNLLDVPRHDLARRGLARSFQNLGVIGELTVAQNVMLGGHSTTGSGLIMSSIRSRRSRREERALRQHANEIMSGLGLTRVASSVTGALPYGTQKRVEFARCLMNDPQVLLLDEPVAGMAVSERAEIAELIHGLRERGLAIVLVEHDMPMVLSLADRVVALDLGRVIAEGTAQEVRSNPAVIDAYLGSSAQEAKDV